MCQKSIETIAAQAGNHLDGKKAVALPLYFSSNYRHDSLDEAKSFDPHRSIHIHEFQPPIGEHFNRQWRG